MQTINTYNGITLGLVEVPKDATYISKYNLQISYRLPNEGYVYVKDIPISNCKLIATTYTLTEEQAKNIVIFGYDTCGTNEDKLYTNYLNDDESYITALESFNSLLEFQGIDLTKNYCILKKL